MIKKIAIYCDLSNSSGLGHFNRMKNLSIELVLAFLSHYSKKDDKKSFKIFKMLKKAQKYPYFGQLCESKKSKKSVEK